MQRPLFSVIIPTYNRAGYLHVAIQSIIAQTCTNWELIVVDDGSSDNTSELMKVFTSQDSRIIYVYQQNAERSAARNNGIDSSSGDYISFLDSDDFFAPDYLEYLEKKIKENNFPKDKLFVTKLCSLNVIVDDKKMNPLFYVPEDKHVAIWMFEQFAVVQVMQIVTPREIFLELRFDNRFIMMEDTHLFLRCLSKYEMVTVPEAESFINSGEQSSVQQAMKKIKMKDVRVYASMINDLFLNWKFILPPAVDDSYRRKYLDAKYRMYLYEASRKKQLKISIRLWFIAFKNRPSLYLATEFPKLLIRLVK